MAAVRSCTNSPIQFVSIEEYSRLLIPGPLIKLQEVLIAEIQLKGSQPPVNTRFEYLNYYANYSLSFLKIPTNQAYTVRANNIIIDALATMSNVHEEDDLHEIGDRVIRQPQHVLTALQNLYLIYEEMKDKNLTGTTRQALEKTITTYCFSLEKEHFLNEMEKASSVLKNLYMLNK